MNKTFADIINDNDTSTNDKLISLFSIHSDGIKSYCPEIYDFLNNYVENTLPNMEEKLEDLIQLRQMQATTIKSNAVKWNEIFEYIRSTPSLWNRYTKVTNTPLERREEFIPFIKLLEKEINDRNSTINDTRRIISDTNTTAEEKLQTIENILS